MINVITSNLILILLTILSACFSGNATLAFFLGGGLMIAVTAGYVRDGGGKLLKLMQLFLAVLFALCSGNWWGCIALSALLWPKAWQSVLFADGALLFLFILRRLNVFGGNGNLIGMSEEISAMTTQQGHELSFLIARWILCLAILNVICLMISLQRWHARTAAEKAGEERRKLIAYKLSEMHEIQKNKELLRQSFYVEKNARLVERENISRNIHNSVGHSITAAIMTLDAADVLFDKKPEEAHRRMNDAAERIRGSLDAIRSAVRALDDEGADVSVKDLICYFDNILDEFLMDTDRTCDRFYEIAAEDRHLPAEYAEFLTGALSELLTNGAKHGGASHYSVKLSGDKSHVRLDVTDNGKSSFSEENGEELIKNGFGLKKLDAYAKRCGGRTQFFNENGFHSVIELPV